MKKRRVESKPAVGRNDPFHTKLVRNGHGHSDLNSHAEITLFGCQILRADARSIPLPAASVDLVVTSPPYWRKRDYGLSGQVGQEETPAAYVAAIMEAMREWKRLLRPTGSLFLNIGDTYWNRSLAGIPGRIATAATEVGWLLRNQIIWAKDRGMPGPVQDRLVSRHEYVLHLTRRRDYYYDLFGYAQRYGKGANPGDVWHIRPTRDMSEHLAPFPAEIVERAVLLACPERVCQSCGVPSRRIVERTMQLDSSRPQARRAMELARIHELTDGHIAAIQAVGVSDAGKALRVQNGTGRNSERVKTLAAEAKRVLGGYFREFTFAQRRSVGWSDCGCRGERVPGVVLDPFCGTATTVRVASALGRTAIGVDLSPQAIEAFCANRRSVKKDRVRVSTTCGVAMTRVRRGKKRGSKAVHTSGGSEGLFG